MSFDFFQNKDCEFFPCHKLSADDFNCMFCYCPLYVLGKGCGGNYKILKNGTKDCSDCLLPHVKGFSKIITQKFDKINQLTKENME